MQTGVGEGRTLQAGVVGVGGSCGGLGVGWDSSMVLCIVDVKRQIVGGPTRNSSAYK